MTDAISRALAAKSTKYNGFYGYNLKAGLLNYKTALSNVANQMVRIHCIGDSITRGEYSSVEFTKSWVGQLRTLLQAQYGNAPGEGWIGVYEQSLPAQASPRWTAAGYNFIQGGGMHMCWISSPSATSTAQASVTFTGTAVRLVYAQSWGGGNADIKIDGTTVGTINCYNASTVFTTSSLYTGLSNGSHTLTVVPHGDGQVYLEGIFTNDNATSGIQVNRIGFSGSMASQWNDSRTLQRWQNIPPHLAIIALGMNECSHWQNVPIATYKQNMAALITTMQNAGASVLLVPYQQPDVSWTGPNQPPYSAYVQAQYELADQYNCGIVDIFQAWGSQPGLYSGQAAWTWAQGQGLFGPTTNDWSGSSGWNACHPSDKGYNYIAQILYRNLIL